MDILRLNDISKSYGDLLAVDTVNINVDHNEIIALLGSNGAGKSTTIKMICGLLKPTMGDLFVNGKRYFDDADSIRNAIGYVPEESAMYNDIGVFDYLHFFARLYRVPKDIASDRMHQHLEGLQLDVGNRRIGELSKGMKRKVLIVRSLLHDPNVLIYDEPASGLDPQTAAFILSFMQRLRNDGKTILFSSHNLGHVEQIADRVIIIHKGKKVFDDSVISLKKVKKQGFRVRHHSGGETKTETMDLAQLRHFMLLHGDMIDTIEPEQQSIEEAFLSFVKEDA
jgi:ABC-2 type transport system ATP-binding protein